MGTIIKCLDTTIAFFGKYPMILTVAAYYLAYKLIRETVERRLKDGTNRYY